MRYRYVQKRSHEKPSDNLPTKFRNLPISNRYGWVSCSIYEGYGVEFIPGPSTFSYELVCLPP